MRVIDENGANLGVMSTIDALNLARERQMDLIEISPEANPPVARIQDFGKFLYQKEKEDKKQRAKQKADVMKGIRLTFNIGEHDMLVRAKKADEFLETCSKVFIELVLRGREKGKRDFAGQKIQEFLTMLKKPYKIVQPIKGTPRSLIIIIGKQ